MSLEAFEVLKQTFSKKQCCCQDLFRSRDQDRDLGHQVSSPRPGQNELECTRVLRPWSRDQITGCINSNW